MTAGPLTEAFRAYETKALHAGVSARQRLELRRAFFGGAQTLLAALRGASPEMVATLCVEIEGHFSDVEAGKA